MQLRLQGVPIPLQLKPCSPVYPKYSVIPDPSLWYVSSGFIIKHNFMMTKYLVTADAPFNITAFGCAQYLKYNLRLWQCPLPLPMPTYFKLVAEFSVTTNTFYFVHWTLQRWVLKSNLPSSDHHWCPLHPPNGASAYVMGAMVKIWLF